VTLSLRLRFAISFAVAFFLTLALLFITLHYSLAGILIADLDDDLDTLSVTLVNEVTRDGAVPRPEALVAALNNGTLDRITGVPVITAVFDPQGNLIRATRSLPIEGRTLRPSDIDRIREGDDWHHTVKPSQGRTLRVGVHPVIVNGELIAIVETAAPLGPVTAATDRLQMLLWVQGAIAALVATGAGYFIARQGVRRLDSVSRLAADIEANDLTRRLHLRRGPLEVRRLADTFDAMLDRLEHAFTLQRSFALDVAHELRTPLTALRGNLDVLLLDPSLDPELRGELERLSAETARLTRLTSNLLALAQSEVGRKAERRPVDLDLICLEVYQQARGLHAGVRLRLGHEDQVTVTGDQDLLKQLILNLVENAMKFTPRGGVVTLSIYADEGSARVVVQDTGPGIRPEDLPHIFERFYRAPAGGGRVTGGAGIGLAVARWIATAHGGDIEVESELGAGSTFTVRLPLEPDVIRPEPAGEPSLARV
jgi:two-component system OmpR family sensor kinase